MKATLNIRYADGTVSWYDNLPDNVAITSARTAAYIGARATYRTTSGIEATLEYDILSDDVCVV